MINLDYWKIQELRAAVLCDLKSLIPDGFYAFAAGDCDLSVRDDYLARKLILMQARDPQLTPRQLAAARLLQMIGAYNTETRCLESMVPEGSILKYQEEIRRRYEPKRRKGERFFHIPFNHPPTIPRARPKPEDWGDVCLSQLHDDLNRYLPYLSEDEARPATHDTPHAEPTSAPIQRRKRAALIREVEGRWPSIGSNLRHAKENGLHAAAKLPEHGDWDLTASLQWAKEHGKMTVKPSQELDPMEMLNRMSLDRNKQ